MAKINHTKDESRGIFFSQPVAADLARFAETALLRGSYRDAATHANRCLSLQIQVTQHKHYSVQTPFRWRTLQSPRYFSVLEGEDDEDSTADAWERSAAVAWQCWYAAASSSRSSQSTASNASLLAPFWCLFTSRHPTGRRRPMRMALLVLILQLCWDNERNDGGNTQWILELATTVLFRCQRQKNGGERCDALGVLLLTAWLPLQPVSTTIDTLAQLDNGKQRVYDMEHTSVVDVLLDFCTTTDDLPWVVRCRDLMVSKLHEAKKKQRCNQLRLVSNVIHEDDREAADATMETQRLLVPLSSSSSLLPRWSLVLHRVILRRVRQFYCYSASSNGAVAVRQSLPIALGTVVLLVWIGRRRVLRQILAKALIEIIDAIIPRQQ